MKYGKANSADFACFGNDGINVCNATEEQANEMARAISAMIRELPETPLSDFQNFSLDYLRKGISQNDRRIGNELFEVQKVASVLIPALTPCLNPKAAEAMRGISESVETIVSLMAQCGAFDGSADIVRNRIERLKGYLFLIERDGVLDDCFAYSETTKEGEPLATVLFLRLRDVLDVLQKYITPIAAYRAFGGLPFGLETMGD